VAQAGNVSPAQLAAIAGQTLAGLLGLPA